MSGVTTIELDERVRAVKILVVDDDRRIVRTTCDILRVKGHEPVAAYSGEEAVAMVRAATPECVLMDIKMPGISGVEALAQIKAIAPALPVILVSAYATDDLLEEARRHGAYAVLTKPLNIQAVLSFLDLMHTDESILIVDDDANFCKTLKDILTLRGFRVDTVGAPDRVVADIDGRRQLVVLLDLKLGAASGLDVLRQIRARYPALPVVLLTGYREEMGDVIENGLRIGAATCLYKPFEIDALLGVIEEIRCAKLRSVLL